MTGQPTPDKTYFFDDGSAVLRVEDTLFKVHRTRLAAASKVFEDMFALPQKVGDGKDCKEPIEGSSEKNPIVVAGDKEAAFRDFLRVLYWQVHETMAFVRGPRTYATSLPMLHVARIAHKYQAVELEKFAISQLSEFLDALADSPAFMLPRAFCAELVEVVHLLAKADRDALEAKVLKALHKLDLAAVLCACEALPVANQALEGQAYWEALRRHCAPWHNFTPAQQVRLLVGYHALSQEWHSLAMAPAQMAWTCKTLQQAWADAAFAPAVQAHAPDDLLGRIDTMRPLLVAAIEKDKCVPECGSWKTALDFLAARRSFVAKRLHGFFVQAAAETAIVKNL
ncbi:hypothetical protein AURDEDRAFT_186568 [Auricularia subglabra TFB-10046 SS5]|uniref:BTB domain-containing protein n=1 Tax=Auricularia subglabra (strain TFB-10046 / SS5) TaxID=717982 RepID=J0WXD3_AURST|nr:hypothetical protein AURDEDRAFT_186568 [Auricularia subglabra TFB-10046 SS5]